MTPAELLQSPNIRAFLYALRFGEGTAGPNGYRTMFGGELFNSYADHPRKAITKSLGGKPITSTAAGAYQYLSRTWDEIAKKYNLPDFTPESQDLGAVGLLIRRGAVSAILAGRIEEAVKLTNKEWASLPGSPYGQPTVKMSGFIKNYTEAGGSLSPQPGGAPVAPFLLAALPALFDAVPKLGELFGGSGASDKAQKNAAAIQIAVDVAKQAIGATNEQDLVDKLKSDPEAAVAVRQAVEGAWYTIVDSTGVPDARKADAAFVAAGKNPMGSPAMFVTFALIPLVYLALYAVLFRDGFSDDIKAMVLGAIFGGLLTGGITAYWFGTSASSARKTELSANKPGPLQ
jgi:muramidase (phage lysozyme)